MTIDPLFFADVFSRRVCEHANHGGYYQDDEQNVRCTLDEELVTPSRQWLESEETVAAQ